MAKTQKSKYAILGALTVFPMSGYDLKKWLKNSTSSFWAESSGRVYPILNNLLKEKLVTCDTSQHHGKRKKKIYLITNKGKKVLEEWLIKPAEPTIYRDEFTLKLFYGKNLSKEHYLAHLLQQQQEFLQRKQKYDKLVKHIQNEHADLDDASFWQITIKKAQYHINAELKWLDEIIVNIKNSQ